MVRRKLLEKIYENEHDDIYLSKRGCLVSWLIEMMDCPVGGRTCGSYIQINLIDQNDNWVYILSTKISVHNEKRHTILGRRTYYTF